MAQSGVSVLKKLFLLVLVSAWLFASQTQTERKIYDAIIHAVIPHHDKPIHLWSDSDKLRNELKALSDVVLVDKADQADIAIITKKLPKQCRCLPFVTSYRLLKKYKDRAIGGFFWQKGRPNILFLQSNLQKAGVKLPQSMQQFVEDGL